MPTEVILSFVRQMLMMGVGIAVGKGIFDAGFGEALVAAGVGLVTSGFSVWAAYSSSKAKKAVAAQ